MLYNDDINGAVTSLPKTHVTLRHCCCCRIDQSGVMSLEKCITQGRPVVVADIRERLNNLVMPLIYHYNTLKEDHTEHGKI